MDTINGYAPPQKRNCPFYFLLAACFLIPIIFIPQLYDVFDLPKLVALKTALLCVMLPALLHSVKKNAVTFSLHPFIIPLAAFLGMHTFSAAISPYPSLSFLEWLNTFSFILFALLVFHYTPQDGAQYYFSLITLSTLITSIYAIMQHLGVDPILWDDANIRFRSTSTLGNPDFLGAYLAMSFPFVLGFTLTAKSPLQKASGGFTLFALFIALLFSFSRGAYLSFFISIFIFMAFAGQKARQTNAKLLILILAGFLFFFYIGSHEKVTIDKKETTATQRIKTTLHMDYPSIAIRRHLWHDTLQMIRAKFWTGFGPGTYTLFFTGYRSPELLHLAGRLSLPESAHNDYLQHAVDSGIFAFFIFVWVVACSVIYVLKKNSISGSNRILNACLLSSLAVFCVENIFYYHVAPTYLLFFLCLGLAPLLNEPKKEKITFSLPFSALSTFILKLTLPILCIGMLIHLFFPVYSSYSFRRGTVKMEKQEISDAALFFLEAKLFSPHDKIYSAYLGKCYEEMGLRVLSSKKKHEKTDEIKFFQLALNEYEDLLKQYPAHSFVLADIGRVEFLMFQLGVDKKGAQKSIESYKQSIRLDPKNSLLYNDLGRVILSQMKIKEAENYFKKAIELEPEYSEAHSNLGLCYYHEKKPKEARFHFYKALESDPQYFDALARLGVMAYEEKKYPEALDYFKKASAVRPEDTLLRAKIKELEKRK